MTEGVGEEVKCEDFADCAWELCDRLQLVLG